MVAPIRRRYPTHTRNPRTDLYTRKMERATKIFQDLQEQSDAGVPIIVEGRRDEAALRKFGVKGTVFCLKATGEPRFSFIERLDGSKRAIVLTDFDREGGELGSWLYQELSHRGIRGAITLGTASFQALRLLCRNRLARSHAWTRQAVL